MQKEILLKSLGNSLGFIRIKTKLFIPEILGFSLAAQRLIKMGKHTVNLESRAADVRVQPFTLEMGIKFEVSN